MAEYTPDFIPVKTSLLFEVLDHLRNNHIYVLMGSEYQDELGDDFKPWKWDGVNIKDQALESSSLYRLLLGEMEREIHG